MLQAVSEKVFSGERINGEEAIALFRSDDIFALGRLASYVAGKLNGRNAYFIVNRHINPTNICVNRCKFCAFSRSKGGEGAFELTIEDILAKLGTGKLSTVQKSNPPLPPFSKGGRGGITKSSLLTSHSSLPYREVHIVGGLHPDRPFGYYTDMLSAIKAAHPSVAIKAFTAVEIDYFSRMSGLPIEVVLQQLKASGFDAMPGGGAEIFAEGVRDKLCPEKISGKRWLEVHEAAHRSGIPTNATMLYGHIETYEDRVDHLMRLRDLQDMTGGFQAFIPLSYHPVNTEIGGRFSSGIDDLKTIAVSRLVLDNFRHIKAYWIMLGEKIAQLALLFGADDLDGTIIEEKITHSAGARSSEGLTKKELANLIRRAGRVPVERDAFYKEVPKSRLRTVND